MTDLSNKGKNTCRKLKKMRRQFADENGIEYEEEECTYNGPCEGTCQYCDDKTKELIQKAYDLAGIQEVNFPQVEVVSDPQPQIENEEDIEEDICCGRVKVEVDLDIE